jgi:DNA topoisomerase VI subunit B
MEQATRSASQLERVTFCTSREMDFFSEKELVTQTGHPREEWHLVFIKELIDNALDACEEADIAPVIDVMADAGGIAVADNGPGLPESTLKGAMDFNVRVSNREAYVAPDRGAQGNALKTLLAMPLVLDPERPNGGGSRLGRFAAGRYGIGFSCVSERFLAQ